MTFAQKVESAVAYSLSVSIVVGLVISYGAIFESSPLILAYSIWEIFSRVLCVALAASVLSWGCEREISLQ